jgi:glycine/D-amino acid oxidase-like deaminating enzyme/nitrite reductase/ring-hydroxylating ferredoxin subunit
MGGNTNKDSLWWKTRSSPGGPPLAEDLTVDVAVVGAGLTGLSAALLLAREGRSVAVLEADRIGSGTTGGTSAHVTQVPDRRYRELKSKFGKDDLRLVADSTRAALERIAALVAEERIDCDWARVSGYLYAESRQDASRIEEEFEAAREVGLPVALARELPLPFPVAAAVCYEDQARFHPTAYALGLAEAARRTGVRICEGTRIAEIEGGEPCRLRSEAGAAVEAGAVILATHTPAGFNLLQTEIEPWRSYVLAARLEGGQAPPDGLFWDTDDPYHYTRLQPDPAGGLLIVGGADHKTGHEEETAASYRDLEAYVRDRWPVAAIEHRWSSQFYEPLDGLPYIGESPLLGKNVYVGTGYSGMGMVFSTLAAMLLTDELAGRSNLWAEVYRTSRIKPLAGGPRFLKMNLEVAAELVKDRVAAPKLEDLSQVPPGEGKVFDVDGEKVAIHRAESGEVHAVSAVCTHAFCLVHWNSAEKTWDCPCHGGRYTVRGEVIEGPPVEGLAPVALPVVR